MPTAGKLLIVSPNLRDHLGHYFETSVSLAEAARRAGWHPLLATHVHCRTEILPSWLESYPLFFTDCPLGHRPADDPFGLDTTSALGRVGAKAWQACLDLAWMAERTSYYALPPAIYDLGRIVGYCGMPRWAHPRHYPEVYAACQDILRRWVVADDEVVNQARPLPETSRRLRDRRQRAKIVQAVRSLVPTGFGIEVEQMLCFQRDLLRFLALAGAGRDDHVLMGTAHPRDAAAAGLAIELLGDHAPTFHLEFLNGLFEGDPAAEASTPSPAVRVRRMFFSLYSHWGASRRIKFYTDSATLARDYETISGARFDVLPIPFRAELISPVPRPPSGPVRLGYFGEARDEKGFPWLPDLAEALRDDYLAPGRARLLIQANVSQPQYNPQSIKALERLGRFSSGEVQLFAAEAPLSPVEYYRMVSQADVVLLPYLNGRYRACTSGVLAEALALGAPPVVPAGTWMADQLPPRGGETFDDFDSFVAAVKRVLDHFASYRAAAQAHRPYWREHHSPDAFVAALFCDRAAPSATRLAAA
ncbi:MAG TPA: hypothetical protein PK867_10665 [Pirellulales bacterium]|nr:hypothetical protein [Pirellulales bacterium]